MSNKIISGQIENIESTIIGKSDPDDYNVDIQTFIYLKHNKKYKVKGKVKDLKKGDIISLIKEDEVLFNYDNKVENYLIITPETMKKIKRKRLYLILASFLTGIYPISYGITYLIDLFLYSGNSMSYFIETKNIVIVSYTFFMMFAFLISSVVILFNIPSKKIIRQVNDIIKEEDSLKTIKEKNLQKVS